ncbi:hypothetical protein OMP38_08295 [Cohnella ginsengisoli]|uniref:Uncharacterized protein n=1 Tax=Cohnella ginsengisoli TaxID=425004 RepID=A0A9X4QLW1_9BACL|nr:hypothetical protein [Cohnella ginsengisoli]MDG0790865.1 hypothetical protein [Cohnella ginsengisoli]
MTFKLLIVDDFFVERETVKELISASDLELEVAGGSLRRTGGACLHRTGSAGLRADGHRDAVHERHRVRRGAAPPPSRGRSYFFHLLREVRIRQKKRSI